MFRTALRLGIVATVLSAFGCTMCCHPYDYTGPVYGDCGVPPSSFNERVGSILGNSADPSYTERISPRSEPEPTPALQPTPAPQKKVSRTTRQPRIQVDQQLGDVAGSEQIVSVTERVVGPTAENSAMASTSDSDSLPSLPSQGWTARRPTSQVLR